ncbi:MAG: hypothetical protein AAFO87_15580 [Cyanobacteria bacterium J06607_6]
MVTSMLPNPLKALFPSLRRWPGALGLCSVALCTVGATGAISQPTSEADTALAPEDVVFETLLNLDSEYGLTDFENPLDAPTQEVRARQEETSLFEPTLPSFWWRRDQLPTLWRQADNTLVRVEGYRLVRDWVAFHDSSTDTLVVDVRVDPQYWNRFNYFQKYAVLQQFGSAGMSYGYHVRVYSSVSLAGVHACDFDSVATSATLMPSQVSLPELSEVTCAAAIGPFIDPISAEFEDLFAPP